MGAPRSTPLASRGPTSRPLLAGSDRPAVGRTARHSCTPLRRTRTRTRAQAVGATGAPSAVCVRCGGCVCLCRSVRVHRSWQGVCNGSSGDRPRVGSARALQLPPHVQLPPQGGPSTEHTCSSHRTHALPRVRAARARTGATGATGGAAVDSCVCATVCVCAATGRSCAVGAAAIGSRFERHGHAL